MLLVLPLKISRLHFNIIFFLYFALNKMKTILMRYFWAREEDNTNERTSNNSHLFAYKGSADLSHP